MFSKKIELFYDFNTYHIEYTREVISKNEIQFLVDEVKTDFSENLQFWVLHYYPLREKNKTEMQIFENEKLNELKIKIADSIISNEQLTFRRFVSIGKQKNII